MLVLEVELLTGVSVAAAPQDRQTVEWPPHPDRVFQALVAAWGRQEPPDPGEREALEWLETLPPHDLRVYAPPARSRTVVDVFVPPNDAATTEAAVRGASADQLYQRVRVIPEFRKNRQPRTFPAAVPLGGRVVVYSWTEASGLDAHRGALERLARETTYLGHSHTLVRVHVGETLPTTLPEEWPAQGGGELRLPYPGRLSELRTAWARGARPLPSTAVNAVRASAGDTFRTCFSSRDVVVFADAGGCVPPALEAFPTVAKRLRDALIRTASDAGIPVSPLLSGHDERGEPTKEPHLAFAPLADVGWAYSAGRLMGIALIWPRDSSSDDRRDSLRAVAGFAMGGGRLHFGSLGTWKLTLDVSPDVASLETRRYSRESREWRTVLPIALDRHPKAHGGEDAPSVIAQACLNVGVPEAALEGAEIEAGPYPALQGAPSVRPVGRAIPAGSPYRGRPLTHAAISFARPVEGPLLLGAGRFRGLGFCLAVPEAPGR